MLILLPTVHNLRRKKFHRANQGNNFGSSVSNRENVRAPIQYRKRKRKLQHLKKIFLQKETHPF